MSVDTFSCMDCGTNKNFPSGLRNKSEKYRCYDCFNYQSTNDVTRIKITVVGGCVDFVDCPEWINYKIMDYDTIEIGDNEEFETREDADAFLDDPETHRIYQLLITVKGGIADVSCSVEGMEVEIEDLD